MKKTSVFQNSLIWFGAGVSIAEILTGTYFAPLGMAKGFAAILLGHLIGCTMMFFAGLIGGRLWDVFFFDWDYYSHHLLEIPFVWQGGMAVQGGMLAGIAAGIVYCKLHDIDWVALADIISPSLLIGQSIGRMANLLNGDAFGTPTGSSFGILYPEGTLAYKTCLLYTSPSPRDTR